MTMLTKWSEIEAECGGYRQGFVETFRKYEGQPTDEKDGQNRTVKVTPRSFALHLGIDERTFRRWLSKSVTESDLLAEASKQKTKAIEQWHVRSAARKNPAALVEAISELPEEHQRQIVSQVHRKQLERAGADFSESGRKAREARTAEYFEPMRQSLNVMQVVPLAERLADKLRNLPADLTDEDRREIDAAVDDVILARTEMHIQSEVDS